MKNFKKNLYKLPLSLSAKEIVIDRDLDNLMMIEKKCFSEKMADDESGFKDQFYYDESAFGLIIYKNNEAIGYISGMIPDDLNESDFYSQVPQKIKDNANKTYYMDSVAIIPEHRSVAAFDFLIHEMSWLLKRKNFLYSIGHARIKSGYSRSLRQRYGAKLINKIENWEGYDEPFDLVYFDVATGPRLPFLLYFLLKAIRRIRSNFI